MVQAIREAGLEVTREGKDYLTVRDPGERRAVQDEGQDIRKGLTYDRELDRAIAPARGLADSRSGNDLESRTRSFRAVSGSS